MQFFEDLLISAVDEFNKIEEGLLETFERILVNKLLEVIEKGSDDLADRKKVDLCLLNFFHLAHDAHEVFQHDLRLLLLSRLYVLELVQDI